MGNTLTIRLPEDLAKWLQERARKTGLPRGRIVRLELEKAKNAEPRPFMRLAGLGDGPANLSMRKGFSRK
jgi:predicted transcriptional regulator